MNTNSEVTKFSDRVDLLRSQVGLSDLKFYAGEVSESSPETFAHEANLMLDAIESQNCKPLLFNDTHSA